MKIIFPDWALENLARNGEFQCGLCMGVMSVEARGDVPHLRIGFEHKHADKCPFLKKYGEWADLRIEVGEIAQLLLDENQPKQPVPEQAETPPFTPYVGDRIPPFPDLQEPD